MRRTISALTLLMFALPAFGAGLAVEDLTVFGKAIFYGDVELTGSSVTAPTNGLVLYHNYASSSMSVEDLSGMGNAGIVYGATWISSGITNGAFSYDGVDDYIEVPNAASLNFTTAMTVSAWVMATAPGDGDGWDGIVTKGNFSDRLFSLLRSGSKVASIYMFGGEGKWAITSTNNICDGQWHQVVTTWDGQRVNLYVDGEEAADYSDPNNYGWNWNVPLVAINDPVWIGRISAQTWYPFQYFNDGAIDEVRLYNRALSSQEVAEMYLSYLGVATSSGKLKAGNVIVTNGISQINHSSSNFFMGLVGIGTDAPQEMLDVHGNAVIRGTISGSGAGITGVSASSVAANSQLALQITQAVNAAIWVEGISNNLSVNPAGYVAVNKLDVSQDTVFRGPVTLGSSLPAGSLALHFDFNSTSAQDLSGNGNNGTLYGSPAWTNNGAKGGTFLFDGNNDSVLVNSSASLQLTNQLTLLAWIRTSASGVWSGIICKQPSAGVATSTPGNYEFMLESSGKPRLRFEYDSTAVEIITALHAVNDGQWHHVGLTVDAVTKAVKIYIDGNLDKSATAVNVPLQKLNNEPVRIGKRKDGCFFSGGIDEPAVYSRVLADSEISSLFSAGRLTAEKLTAAKELWVGGMKVADSNGMLATALPAGVVTNGSSPTFGIITGDGSGITNIPGGGLTNTDVMLKSDYVRTIGWENNNTVDRAATAASADSARPDTTLAIQVQQGTNAWQWIQDNGGNLGSDQPSDLSMGPFTSRP